MKGALLIYGYASVANLHSVYFIIKLPGISNVLLAMLSIHLVGGRCSL